MPRDELSYCRICAAACGIVVTVDGDQVRPRARRRRPSRCRAGTRAPKGRGLAGVASLARPPRPPAAARRATSRGTSCSPTSAGDSNAIIDDERTRRGRALPRDRSRVRRGRPDRGEPVAAVDRQSLVPHRGHGRQRARARRGRVGERRADAEPGVGSDRRPASRSSSARTRSSRTATAPRSPIRCAASATTAPRGGRVWVLDPRRTETAALADVHVPVRPGADVAVLGALANALLERRRRRARAPRALRSRPRSPRCARALAPFTIERAATRRRRRRRRCSSNSSPTCARAPGRIAMQCGTGVTMSRDGVVAEWLRWVVLIASGSLDRAAGMHFHRGAHPSAAPAAIRAARRGRRRRRRAGPSFRASLGQIPAVALADEIEAGNIRALFVTGGNPLTAFPQPDRLRAALADARRARGRRRRREPAHRARDARAARDRAARTGRHHARRADRARIAAPGDAAGRRRRSPTAGRSGGCSRR